MENKETFIEFLDLVLRYISLYKYFIVPLFILFMNKGLFITIYDWKHKLVTYLPTILITLIESSKSNHEPTSINIDLNQYLSIFIHLLHIQAKYIHDFVDNSL